MNRIEALAKALMHAITASTREEAEQITQIADQLADGLSEFEIYRAKKLARQALEEGDTK